MNEQNENQLERIVVEENRKMGPVARIINLFVAPTELMQNIKLYPVILVPLLVSIILALVAIPFVTQYSEMTMQELSIISLELHGTDLSGWTQMQEASVYGDPIATDMGAFAVVGQVVGAVIMPFLYCLIAAVIFIILVKIFRGSAKFGQLYSMCMHYYVISALGSLIVVALAVTTGRFIDLTSLAAVLMPNGNISMVSFNVLSSISIFNIWVHIVIFIGIKVLNDFSSVKAGIITTISFLLTIAINVGIMMSTFIIWDMTMGAM